MTRTTQITNLLCPRKNLRCWNLTGQINTHHDTKRSYILVQNSKQRKKSKIDETRKHMKSGKDTVLETKSESIVSFDWMTEKYLYISRVCFDDGRTISTKWKVGHAQQKNPTESTIEWHFCVVVASPSPSS